MCDLARATIDTEPTESFLDETLFLINMTDPWYGDLILYLQTQHFQPNLSRDDYHRIRPHAKYYLIINEILYHRGIDSIL